MLLRKKAPFAFFARSFEVEGTVSSPDLLLEKLTVGHAETKDSAELSILGPIGKILPIFALQGNVSYVQRRYRGAYWIPGGANWKRLVSEVLEYATVVRVPCQVVTGLFMGTRQDPFQATPHPDSCASGSSSCRQ